MRVKYGCVINPISLPSCTGAGAGQTRSEAEAAGMPGSVGESGGRAGAGRPGSECPH